MYKLPLVMMGVIRPSHHSETHQAGDVLALVNLSIGGDIAWSRDASTNGPSVIWVEDVPTVARTVSEEQAGRSGLTRWNVSAAPFGLPSTVASGWKGPSVQR